MSASSDLPPVVVLGVDSPIGLTVVRELGEHGVPVHGIARSPRGVGLYSRWVHRGYLQAQRGPSDIDLIRQIGRDSGAAFVMAVSMRDVVALREADDAGQLGKLRALVAPRHQLDIVNDKALTYAAATHLGIATPRAWEPPGSAWDGAIPNDLTFPCVLKWRDPDRIAPELFRNGLRLHKFIYAYSTQQLRDILDSYRRVGEFPLVQSYAPGAGLGQMFLMHRGKALLKFQHRRIAEWPPEGGTSAVCESLDSRDNRELMAKSEALLQHIGWSGAAMVEYRFDAASGSAILMEINGRFWGSQPLAYHAGVQFAWGTYAALGLDRADLLGTTVACAGVRCRYAAPELRRLFAITFRRSSIQNRELKFCRACEIGGYVLAFLRPRTHFYIFQFRDPRPFLYDARFILQKAFGGLRQIVARPIAKACRALWHRTA